MTKPEDIPQEIWDRASTGLHVFCNNHHFWGELGAERSDDLHEIFARAILSAVEEERSACAQIAQDYDGLGREPSEGAAYGDASLTQLDIASTIRNRKEG